MKAIFRLYFFDELSPWWWNWKFFFDNIAVKPFVGLFAYHDSRRPLELHASLSMKKSWSQPSLGFLTSAKARFPMCLVPARYRKQLLDFPQSSPLKETHEKTRPIKEKDQRVYHLFQGSGCEALYFSGPTWFCPSHITSTKATTAQRCWRKHAISLTFQNELGAQESKWLFHYWLELFLNSPLSFLEWKRL